MTDEVAAHVLAHNYDQTLGLSLQQANAPAELDAQAAFMAELETRGRLDRRVEGLPRRLAIADLRTQGRGLTRPELAVLTAYGKLELSADIVASAAPDDPYFFETLQAYFPQPLARFEDEMRQPPAAARDHRHRAGQRHRGQARTDFPNAPGKRGGLRRGRPSGGVRDGATGVPPGPGLGCCRTPSI